jgi:hypothetical protein
MRAFLATVLSVIAVGVLLIAYGLLAPRASAASPGGPGSLGGIVVYDPQTGMYQLVQTGAAGRIALPESRGYGAYQAVPVGYNTPAAQTAPAIYRPAVYTEPVVYTEPQAPVARMTRAARAPQSSAARVEQRPGRNWKKTALVIGGSTAAGAGIGAMVGGKKGALIGAAIGGGASGLYEAKKEPR